MLLLVVDAAERNIAVGLASGGVTVDGDQDVAELVGMTVEGRMGFHDHVDEPVSCALVHLFVVVGGSRLSTSGLTPCGAFVHTVSLVLNG